MNLSTVAGLVTGLISGALERLGITTGGVYSPGGPTVTATDAVIVGAATTSGVRLDLESGTLAVREGDDSAYAPARAFAYYTPTGTFRMGEFSQGLVFRTDASIAGACRPAQTVIWTAAAAGQFGWSSDTDASSGTYDTGLARSAAGVVAVTNGSTVIKSLTGGATTLTDNTATSLFTIALASGAFCGGTIRYSILVTDGTDHQVRTGMVTFSAVDKAGVLTSAIDEAAGQSIAASAGTLTDAWTILDGSNAITIRLQADSSLTPSAMTVRWNADIFGAATTVTVP